MATGRNTTFCPQFRVDNHCYCTSEYKLKYPSYCDVECVKFHHGEVEAFPHAGCQCRDYLGGAYCERALCHYTPSRFYDERYYQLFCLDGYDASGNSTTNARIRVDENCTVANLYGRPASYFPQCPCLNGGYRLDDPVSGDLTCQCARGYTGSLCQIDPPPFNRPSPGPTVGVIAFLAAVFVVIGLALWYRKRQQMKMYSKMYQLDPIKTETGGPKRFSVFAPTHTPPRSHEPTIAGGSTPGDPTIPDAAAPKYRRLSTLFAGRHAPKPPGRKRQPKPPTNVPTVYEGGEDQSGGQQQPGQAYEDQFGLAPQYQTTGMSLT